MDLPEIVKAWMGKAVVAVERTVTVEKESWLIFCAAVHDGNPLYWDESFAQHHTGSTIAPPAMLPSWGSQHEWYPGKQGAGIRPMELHFRLKEVLGYSNGIVTSVELEYHEPLRAGDSVRVEQILRKVSEERETRLGPGRNWTIDVVYRRHDRVLLGLQTVEFLGYRSG
jgi:acyl dehydratase